VFARDDIQDIFIKVSKNKPFWTFEQFFEFLHKEQGMSDVDEETVSRLPWLCMGAARAESNEQARRIINRFEPQQNLSRLNQISAGGLIRFLLSFDNRVVDSKIYSLHMVSGCM
jgi:hypothetical protein